MARHKLQRGTRRRRRRRKFSLLPVVRVAVAAHSAHTQTLLAFSVNRRRCRNGRQVNSSQEVRMCAATRQGGRQECGRPRRLAPDYGRPQVVPVVSFSLPYLHFAREPRPRRVHLHLGRRRHFGLRRSKCLTYGAWKEPNFLCTGAHR